MALPGKQENPTDAATRLLASQDTATPEEIAATIVTLRDLQGKAIDHLEATIAARGEGRLTLSYALDDFAATGPAIRYGILILELNQLYSVKA